MDKINGQSNGTGHTDSLAMLAESFVAKIVENPTFAARLADSLAGVVEARMQWSADEIKARHAKAVDKVLTAIYRSAAVKRGYLDK